VRFLRRRQKYVSAEEYEPSYANKVWEKKILRKFLEEILSGGVLTFSHYKTKKTGGNRAEGFMRGKRESRINTFLKVSRLLKHL